MHAEASHSVQNKETSERSCCMSRGPKGHPAERACIRTEMTWRGLQAPRLPMECEGVEKCDRRCLWYVIEQPSGRADELAPSPICCSRRFLNCPFRCTVAVVCTPGAAETSWPVGSSEQLIRARRHKRRPMENSDARGVMINERQQRQRQASLCDPTVLDGKSRGWCRNQLPCLEYCPVFRWHFRVTRAIGNC